MRLVDRLRRRAAAEIVSPKPERHPDGLEPEQSAAEAACRHLNLSPKWQQEADIAPGELAYRLECAVCGNTWTPDEARELRAPG